MTDIEITALIPINPGATLPPIGRWALFLDIDGTLLEIAAAPDSVVVPEELVGLLEALHVRLDGAVAFVSGRALSAIDRLVAPLHLAAAGQHGAEIRRNPDAPIELLIDSAKVVAAAERLRDLEARHPGVLVENKGLSIAVHFRNAPEAEPEIRQAVLKQAALSAGALEVLGGKMVWDLHPSGVTKGTAIELLLGAPPFLGRAPIVLGDDRTDEFGFEAARRQGGAGILIGPPGPTTASFRLPDPQSCRRWLGSVASGNL